MQVGLVAKKIGMSQVLSDDGRSIPITLLKLGKNVILAHKIADKHGYDAVVVGAFPVHERKLTKPMRVFFSKQNAENFGIIKEFRTSGDKVAVGAELGLDTISLGEVIDVTGVSIGKGFAGGIKRHGFGGLRASHGVSITHRCLGSTGQRQEPAKVFKGKKMAGHMGAKQVTMLNLPVHSVDSSLGLIAVKGSIPGAKNGVVFLRSAVKGVTAAGATKGAVNK
ncbi:MAG: 50S ribosomal protein L3 [Holosporales bacterium]|jgi:large subunit ribosomal protein L3|nr:50S ribosomal protein L3 [Holosporales bacterium]